MSPLLSANARALRALSVDLARTRAERQRALELRRDVYRRKGLLREDVVKPPVPPQACVPGSAMFVAKQDDTVVGTITFYMDSPIGLPMDGVHHQEVEATRRRFTRLAEVGGLAVREDRRGLGMTMLLYEATVRWALATRAHYLVACVNPASRRVYSRLLFFDVLGECRSHPLFRGAPSIPIGLDLAAALQRYREAHADASDRGHRFFRDLQPRYAAEADAERHLHWSDDEVAEMIQADQLVLDGNEHLYVQRHYSAVDLARCPR